MNISENDVKGIAAELGLRAKRMSGFRYDCLVVAKDGDSAPCLGIGLGEWIDILEYPWSPKELKERLANKLPSPGDDVCLIQVDFKPHDVRMSILRKHMSELCS